MNHFFPLIYLPTITQDLDYASNFQMHGCDLTVHYSILVMPAIFTTHDYRRFRIYVYSETSLIRHSMGPENNVGLGGCWIMECLLPYLCMVTVPHIMVGLE